MSSLNYRVRSLVDNPVGVKVPEISAEKQLKRMVNAAFLWEDQYYLDGVSHAEIISKLVAELPADIVADCAIEAREVFKLRHIPLLLCRELARNNKLHYKVLDRCIKRADEMSEFLSIYWKEGKTPLSNQVKKGLAAAFVRFSEYDLAKWDKNSNKISIRDVMFLSHPKPQSPEQELLFKKVANQELQTPDTWETELSKGMDKCATFTRLILENKLGALAFLRNLRTMINVGVNTHLIQNHAISLNVDNVLPFRYITAARHCPTMSDMLETLMIKGLSNVPKLKGRTVLLVDVSGSMFGAKVSRHSELDRFDAAAALAMLCKEICENVEIYSFSDKLVKLTNARGFSLKNALENSQSHQGTKLGWAIDQIIMPHDRIIVFTDEASFDVPKQPRCNNAYIVNVASYKNGVNQDRWTTITGFSEQVIEYIQQLESSN